MRGQAGRPIWIVITLVLALIVGLTMYKMLQKTSPEESIGKMYSKISGDQALSEVINFCSDWYRANFAYGVLDEKKYIQASYAAANENLPVKYLDATEIETTGTGLGPAGCVVILYHAATKLGWAVGISPVDLKIKYKEICQGNLQVVGYEKVQDWEIHPSLPGDDGACYDTNSRLYSLAVTLGLATNQ